MPSSFAQSTYSKSCGRLPVNEEQALAQNLVCQTSQTLCLTKNTTLCLTPRLLMALSALILHQLCRQSPQDLSSQKWVETSYADHNLVASRRDVFVYVPAARSFVPCRAFYVSNSSRLLILCRAFTSRTRHQLSFAAEPSVSHAANGPRRSCGATLKRSQTNDFLIEAGVGSFRRWLGGRAIVGVQAARQQVVADRKPVPFIKVPTPRRGAKPPSPR